MKDTSYETRIRSTHDLLLLVDIKVPLVVMREWSSWELEQAEKWAGQSYLAASDNVVRIPSRPRCLWPYLPKAGA